MTPKQYARIRRKIGTQETVAALLGVHRVTIAKREANMRSVPPDAEKAIEELSEKMKP